MLNVIMVLIRHRTNRIFYEFAVIKGRSDDGYFHAAYIKVRRNNTPARRGSNLGISDDPPLSA